MGDAGKHVAGTCNAQRQGTWRHDLAQKHRRLCAIVIKRAPALAPLARVLFVLSMLPALPWHVCSCRCKGGEPEDCLQPASSPPLVVHFESFSVPA